MLQFFSKPHILDAARWKNMRVGLLGGSFNPPHEGHVHISLAAMKALELDFVWWLVSPQNPLKENAPLPLDERMNLSRKLTTHPRILVSDIERDFGTQITFETIRKIKIYFPHTEFVWISGMDNAHSLHEWNHWQRLLKEICMVHLSRSPAKSLVQNSPIKNYKRQTHRFISRGGRLPLEPSTTYWLLQKKMVNISSTEIRNKNSKTNI